MINKIKEELNRVAELKHNIYKRNAQIRFNIALEENKSICIEPFVIHYTKILINDSIDNNIKEELNKFLDEKSYYACVYNLDVSMLDEFFQRDKKLILNDYSYICIGFDKSILEKYGNIIKELKDYTNYDYEGTIYYANV